MITKAATADGAKALSDLLAILRAMHQTYWTAHWQVMGDYGDHLLFERLYTGMLEEIDTLAEKIVGLYGAGFVSASHQIALQALLANQWEQQENHVYRGLHMEEYLQRMIRNARNILESLGTLTLGLDDYLAATASAHETNQYLLSQRAKTRLATGRVSPYDLKGPFSNAPLKEWEQRKMPKVNMWIMDLEMEGGGLPPEVQRVDDLRRRLKPAEKRVLIKFYEQSAPGNY